MKKMLLLLAIFASACTTTGSIQDEDLLPISKEPNFSQAYEEYLDLGARYLQMGRYDLAEPKLKRAIEIDSSNPAAWNVLSVLYEEKRDIASGYQTYVKLTRSHPNYILGFKNFATFLCRYERDNEFKDLIQKMISKSSKEFRAEGYVAEGNCALNRQNYKAAASAYKQALTVDSYSIGALLPLAQIAEFENNAAEALRYLKVIHTYIGYSPESVALAIRAARSTGDSILEQNMLRVMRASYSNTPQAQEFLGK